MTLSLSERIDAYSRGHSGHVTGPLHIIIDDCNAERYWLREMGEQAEAAGDREGYEICRALWDLPPEDRIQALGFDETYLEYHDNELEQDVVADEKWAL